MKLRGAQDRKSIAWQIQRNKEEEQKAEICFHFTP
jgi:hypothetical protein